jgi:hypothetical protein
MLTKTVDVTGRDPQLCPESCPKSKTRARSAV